MNYEALSEEVRSKLEASKVAMVRYSSSIDDPAGKVDDAVLVSKDSEIVTGGMEGYVVGPVGVWFEFVTSGKEDEEALLMAEEAAAYAEEAATEPVTEEAIADEIL